jgi:hypothetical protein
MCPRLPSLPCAPSPSWRGPLWDRFLRDELEASWQDRPAWGILRVSRNPSDPRRATIFRHYIRLNIYHKVQGSGIGLIGAAGSQHRAPLAAARGAPPASGAALLLPPCWRTGPPIITEMFFPRGAGWLKIPYGVAPRFRSASFLRRLRATKTLIRSASRCVD